MARVWRQTSSQDEQEGPIGPGRRGGSTARGHASFPKAKRRKEVQVIGSVFWDEVGAHTVKATALVYPWQPAVALDAWVIME